MGKSTNKATQILLCSPIKLLRLIWNEEIPRPQRIDGVQYIWSDEDIERARVALAKRAAARMRKGARE
jgi:hypothetical protein